jgi:hypothetical protein
MSRAALPKVECAIVTIEPKVVAQLHNTAVYAPPRAAPALACDAKQPQPDIPSQPAPSPAWRAVPRPLVTVPATLPLPVAAPVPVPTVPVATPVPKVTWWAVPVDAFPVTTKVPGWAARGSTAQVTVWWGPTGWPAVAVWRRSAVVVTWGPPLLPPGSTGTIQ